MKVGCIVTGTLLAAGWLPAAEQAAQPQSVQIQMSGSNSSSGKLYGDSKSALILCHGRFYKTGGDSFAEQCLAFKQRGIACLAINFRGYPSQSPPDLAGKEEDVIAAFEFLVQRGATRIFVLGSSMGGYATLAALKTLDARPQLAGIIIISASDPAACAQARCRKLFIAAENDPSSCLGVKATHTSAPEPKQLLIFDHGGHGQALFKNRGAEMMNAISKFIETGT